MVALWEYNQAKIHYDNLVSKDSFRKERFIMQTKGWNEMVKKEQVKLT